MKLVVTGGRYYADRELVFSALDRIHTETPIALLIHGACGWDADRLSTIMRTIQGADGLADIWAVTRRVPVLRVPAAWSKLGGRAGPIRNGLMLDYRPDLVLAFPGNRGTIDCIKQATERGICIVHARAST